MNSNRFAGKVVVITGAGSGIGRDLALLLGERGARLVLSGRRRDRLDAVCDEVATANATVLVAPCDVADAQQVREWAASILRATGRIDVLVNNAGAAWGVPFEEFPESGWDKVMDLNVKSPFFLTQALHGLLKAGAAGGAPAKVINITSIDGLRLNPWETYSYHASKSALIYLTKRLAARLVRDGINVTSIAPGAFASEMNRAARDHGDAVAKAIPARRIGADEDMAGTAIYLASRAGDYVIGETIAVDGGIVNASLGTSIDA